ncbi:EAL domain, c-di-GMP-specific phosphodiesterase class I (or its enzymatically inactive variant) [Paraburkholderia phenazinium]|jgi:EAL domain-containing protein (putative c-di-GMP-specific phosphodiesterase class I)|uniref:EAL domain, c-di-GMP-specific phosphodiesterase class I (Or its enzymatically inactive variant) n=1 Tax=Paraburkholderia phenazinium TaxID=60549 RepID=A0A1G7VBW0_9BURK|nr:EAL domain-containing protein [Paraburkholderia phenazinium]SDG57207.1 EAL domain, c-di-GMP-specific phosphodiesterase class I (or its enzymatically inactive variant) [Paraburkholderia phenazinium]
MEHIAADHRELCTIDDAERGLARREFFFVYQPKLRLQEGRLSGFESLLRWRHPLLGLLTPNSFINLVEDSPLTESFTNFVVAEAAQTLADWSVRGYNTLSLAVNLPASEIGRSGLTSKLSALLHNRSINVSRLQIEVTESTDPGSIEALASAIESLKESGVSVAIDDFGAGCWSLTVLHRLGVDTLKLDRKFMCDIQDNANSKVVVEALIQLGQRLGMQVVVEGVETQAQFEWVSTIEHIDCQGYYISAPIGREQIGEFVARHRPIH